MANSRTRALVSVIGALLLVGACSDSTTPADAGPQADAAPDVKDAAPVDAAEAAPIDTGPKDPSTSCQDTCKQSGFGGSRVDIQPQEVNCFCNSGAGEVSDARCTDFCTGIGKAKGARFKSNGAPSFDACQCS